MEDLTQLLKAQKEQIVKELDQVKHEEFTLKVKRSKLQKMLSAVDKQITLATEETKKHEKI